MPPVPSNEFQLLALLAITLPGVVREAVLTALRGPSPQQRDATTRILNVLLVSMVFALIYLPLVAPWLTHHAAGGRWREWAVPDWFAVSGIAMLLLFAIPAGVAVIQHVAAGGSAKLYDPTPSAWDYAFGDTKTEQYVRIMLKDGTFVGGLFGRASFAAAYPDPHELLLEKAIAMGKDGTFGETRETPLWILGDQIATVEFIPATTPAGDEGEA